VEEAPASPATYPDFVFVETVYHGSNGKTVIRRSVCDGKEPDTWREFFGVTEVPLPKLQAQTLLKLEEKGLTDSFLASVQNRSDLSEDVIKVIVEAMNIDPNTGNLPSSRHQTLFPFFGITTHIFKNPMKCVKECWKIYDERENEAIASVLAEFCRFVKEAASKVKEEVAKVQEEQAKAQADGGTKIILPTGNQAIAHLPDQRHLDKDGNEIPAPAPVRPRKNIILGGG